MLFLFTLLPLQLAHAEYRAFLLKITPKDGEPILIKSTLDPWQYVGYHSIPEGAGITYIDTWRCRERTNYQPICKSPKELQAEQAVAGADSAGTNGANGATSVAASPDRQPASKP